MALTTCHECGHSISSGAMVCPKCGAGRPISRRTKLVAFVASLVFAGILIEAWNERATELTLDATIQEWNTATLQAVEEEKAKKMASEKERELKRQEALVANQKKILDRVEREKKLEDSEFIRAHQEQQAADKEAQDAWYRAKLNPQPSRQFTDSKMPVNDQWIPQKRKQAFDKAIRLAESRRWITFGGTAASEARITNYQNGVFTLTNADGKTKEVRTSRFIGADRAYVDQWLTEAKIK